MFTLFIPGVESVPAGCLPRMPALERLLARGRARPLRESPWALLARLAGGDLARWPVGPVSALAEFATCPTGCLRAEPLGTAADLQGALRLPAGELGIGLTEAMALAAAFDSALGDAQFRLQVAIPERWYLAWDAGCMAAADWQGFEGPDRSLAGAVRPAPPEPGLRRLVSEIEMLFHAHPVNVARRERGAAIIGGLHPWGGGPAPAAPRRSASPPAGLHTGEPYLAGLARLGAIPAPAGRPAFWNGKPARGGVAWPVAIETADGTQFAAVETDWAAPLLRMLIRGHLEAVTVVTGRAVHETRRFDLLRAWRRSRPAGELC